MNDSIANIGRGHGSSGESPVRFCEASPTVQWQSVLLHNVVVVKGLVREQRWREEGSEVRGFVLRVGERRLFLEA